MWLLSIVLSNGNRTGKLRVRVAKMVDQHTLTQQLAQAQSSEQKWIGLFVLQTYSQDWAKNIVNYIVYRCLYRHTTIYFQA